MWKENKWLIYQRERFPVVAHGPLIAAFSLSAVSFSALLRGGGAVPGLRAILTAFATSFLFFLQLRIADEFKDFEEDRKYRPYRPVPRGVVSLPQLGRVFAAGAVVQFLLAAFWSPRLLILLGLTWVYLALMSKEFFLRTWLKRHPLVYMISHMMIMPLVDLYATACDWLPSAGGPPPGLFWFLIASFFNGMVIEIGRKIRAPRDEEKGVETYSMLWGRTKAAAAWLLVMSLTAFSALQAAAQIKFLLPATAILALLILGALAIVSRYLKNPLTPRAKLIETYSGVWTLCLYLSLGILPLLISRIG